MKEFWLSFCDGFVAAHTLVVVAAFLWCAYHLGAALGRRDMPLALLSGGGALAALLLIWGCFCYWQDRALHNLQMQFKRDFPDRCFLCSFYAHGFREGAVKPGRKVPEHQCIEGNRRFPKGEVTL